MEIRQLRYFAVLAKELSFTRAARRLHVSQPPLSFQIANLERELGARLFERTSRSVALSAAGAALLPHARAVLERLEEARTHVRQVAEGSVGRVRVGLSGSHFLGPFPHFIREFRERRPRLEIVLVEMRPVDHLQALRDGRLDISVSRREIDDGEIVSRLLWRDPVVAVLPRGHRLAARKLISLADLRDDAFVFLRLDSSWFAQRVHDACIDAGFAPRIAQQVVEVPAAVNLVAAGLGVSLVPASLAHLRSDKVALCRIRDPLPPGDVHVLRHARESQVAVLEFASELERWARQLPSMSTLRPKQAKPATRR